MKMIFYQIMMKMFNKTIKIRILRRMRTKEIWMRYLLLMRRLGEIVFIWYQSVRIRFSSCSKRIRILIWLRIIRLLILVGTIWGHLSLWLKSLINLFYFKIVIWQWEKQTKTCSKRPHKTKWTISTTKTKF